MVPVVSAVGSTCDCGEADSGCGISVMAAQGAALAADTAES